MKSTFHHTRQPQPQRYRCRLPGSTAGLSVSDQRQECEFAFT